MLYKVSQPNPILGLLVASTLLVVFMYYPLTAFGQSTPLAKSTSGGSLKVQIQPTPNTAKVNAPTKFKITFSKPQGSVQPHIDYDFLIDKNGKNLFSASSSTGQTGTPLHTAEGVVTIPYVFQTPGNYTLTVKVYGILFNPIRPESADFSINAT